MSILAPLGEMDSLEVLWEDAERVFCRMSRDDA